VTSIHLLLTGIYLEAKLKTLMPGKIGTLSCSCNRLSLGNSVKFPVESVVLRFITRLETSYINFTTANHVVDDGLTCLSNMALYVACSTRAHDDQRNLYFTFHVLLTSCYTWRYASLSLNLPSIFLLLYACVVVATALRLH
jgi:hypothetical protein